jgi:hypothetical protein
VIWLNPWAWFGLAALAVPVAVHFLTRAQPRPQPFPTLRFLTVATTSAMRRRMLRDRALLAVRMAILAAVVAALAQPYIKTASRRAAGASTLSRAVVVDASASMNRPTPDGRRAIDVARDNARALQPVAATTTAVDADDLRDGMTAATTWLVRRGGRGELVIVSDFQQGSVSAADLATVPSTIGVTLVKIDVPASSTATGPATRIGDRVWTPRLTMDAARTSVTWTAAARPNSAPPVRIVGAAADATRIATAGEAATGIGTPADAATHPIVIELADAPDAVAFLAAARPIDAPWMFDAVERIRTDSSVAAAATVAAVDATAGHATTGVVVARDASGAAAIEAVSRGTGPASDLVFFTRSNDALLLAALVRATAAAGQTAVDIKEQEPTFIASDALAAWQRPVPATGSPVPDDPNASDGRWLWMLALALFALETWLRRNQPAATMTEAPRARVA